jgi:hypothetical protein
MYYVIFASQHSLHPATAQGSLRYQTRRFKNSEIVYMSYRMTRRGRVMSNDICRTKRITEFSTRNSSRALFCAISIFSPTSAANVGVNN